jgi:hypothetical protein
VQKEEMNMQTNERLASDQGSYTSSSSITLP